MSESLHLRYCMWTATKCGVKGHPQAVMKGLRIKYQIATPQSIADQWWFWNCEDVLRPLPEYLTKLELDPMKAIGYGLSEEQAKQIQDNE